MHRGAVGNLVVGGNAGAGARGADEIAGPRAEQLGIAQREARIRIALGVGDRAQIVGMQAAGREQLRRHAGFQHQPGDEGGGPGLVAVIAGPFLAHDAPILPDAGRAAPLVLPDADRIDALAAVLVADGLAAERIPFRVRQP